MQTYFILPSQESLKLGEGEGGIECKVAHFYETSKTCFFTLRLAAQGHSVSSQVSSLLFFLNATCSKSRSEREGCFRATGDAREICEHYLIRVVIIQVHKSFMTIPV